MVPNSFTLPLHLQQEAERWAAKQGISLDKFILAAVAAKVASLRQLKPDDPADSHITYRQGVSGHVDAVIKGTGIRVQTIAIAAHQWGLSISQLASEYALTEAQVSDALLFYAEHRDAIDSQVAQEQAIEASTYVLKLHLPLPVLNGMELK